MIGVAAEIQRRVGLNHDVAWYLHVAAGVANGSELYRDVSDGHIEVNPPLVVWMLLPPIRLATLVGLPIALVPSMLVAAQAAVSIALSALILRCSSGTLKRLPWLLSAAVLWLPGHAWAQREHQVAILLLPILADLATASHRSNRPTWLRLCAGAAAGVGCALKPYFVIAWTLLEVVVALVDRQPRQWLRLETTAGVLVVAVYGLTVVSVEPDYLTLMREWGPLYLQMSTKPVWSLLDDPDAVASLLVLLFVTPLRSAGEWGRAAFVFGLGSAAFGIAVILQRKGFDYHWWPSFTFSVIALGSAIIALKNVSPRPIVAPVIHVLGVFMLLFIAVRITLGSILGQENRRLAVAYARAAASAQRSGLDRSLVVLSSNLGHAFPMVTALGSPWPLRWPSLWALETASRGACHPPSGPYRHLEQKVRDAYWEDLRRIPPATLVVAPLPPGMRPRSGCLTFLDHLASEPRFATLFASYTAADTIAPGWHPALIVLHRRQNEIPRVR